MQLLYLRSTMLQEIVYQWRNGFNALDDRRFLSDPKLLAAEIRQVYPTFDPIAGNHVHKN